MGMRCSQPQGLSAEAEQFLRDNAVRINEYQCCHRHDGYQKEVIGTCGILEDVNLYRYILLDGSTADEFVQHCVWNSGPMEWFGLRWKDTEFKWQDKEIENNNDDDELADYGMSHEASYYEDVRKRNESQIRRK